MNQQTGGIQSNHLADSPLLLRVQTIAHIALAQLIAEVGHEWRHPISGDLAISADGREGRCGARSGCRKDSRSFYEHLDDLLLRELALMRVVQKGSNVSGQLARGQRVSGDAQRAANQLLRAGALVSQPLGLAVDAHATGNRAAEHNEGREDESLIR
jgi:hypothetical protein